MYGSVPVHCTMLPPPSLAWAWRAHAPCRHEQGLREHSSKLQVRWFRASCHCHDCTGLSRGNTNVLCCFQVFLPTSGIYVISQLEMELAVLPWPWEITSSAPCSHHQWTPAEFDQRKCRKEQKSQSTVGSCLYPHSRGTEVQVHQHSPQTK